MKSCSLILAVADSSLSASISPVRPRLMWISWEGGREEGGGRREGGKEKGREIGRERKEGGRERRL